MTDQELTTYMIIVIAAALTFIIFYQIVKSATKSKQLLQNSNMQLNVLVQMALKNGVDESLLGKEIEKVDLFNYAKVYGEFSNGKITRDEHLKYKEAFKLKYPNVAV